MLDANFIDIVRKLITEQGLEIFSNFHKCKAYISDYSNGNFKRETKCLLDAVQSGCAETYIKSTSSFAKNVLQQSLKDQLMLNDDAANFIADLLEEVKSGTNKPAMAIVYILGNKSFHENGKPIYKIGFTKDLNRRIAELSNATGVPAPFYAEMAWKVPDARAKEQQLHTVWSPFRISNNREFFREEVKEATRVLMEAWGCAPIYIHPSPPPIPSKPYYQPISSGSNGGKKNYTIEQRQAVLKYARGEPLNSKEQANFDFYDPSTRDMLINGFNKFRNGENFRFVTGTASHECMIKDILSHGISQEKHNALQVLLHKQQLYDDQRRKEKYLNLLEKWGYELARNDTVAISILEKYLNAPDHFETSVIVKKLLRQLKSGG